MRTRQHYNITHATNRVESDGELVAVSETVRATVATLCSLEMLRQRRPALTPALTNPRQYVKYPVDFVRASYTMLRGVLGELAWRLVDHVTVQFQCNAVCMPSVPMWHTLPPGCTPLGAWPMLDPLPGAPPAPTTVVRCLWAVYKAQVTPKRKKFVIMNVHHQSNEEDWAGVGVTWWSRSCDTDREAVVHVESQDADRLLRYDKWYYARPAKPQAPPLGCYTGRAIDRQPQCITVMVVRTTDLALTAAVATACRSLGLSNNMQQLEVTEERIDADPEMQPELEDLLTRLGDMLVPWAEFEEHPANMVLGHLINHFRQIRPRSESRQRDQIDRSSHYGSQTW